jgi:hypothetical protein
MNLNYSVFTIRDIIKEKILNNSVQDLLFKVNNQNVSLPSLPSKLSLRHNLPNCQNYLYYYHLTNIIALEIGKKHYSPIRYKIKNNGIEEMADSISPIFSQDNNISKNDINTETYLVEVLMQQDLNKVNLFFALTAWMSIDTFRWHELEGFEHIPEDLSYGLVTDYYDLLLPYGAFVSNLDRYIHYDLLDSSEISKLTKIAEQSVLNHR